MTRTRRIATGRDLEKFIEALAVLTSLASRVKNLLILTRTSLKDPQKILAEVIAGLAMEGKTGTDLRKWLNELETQVLKELVNQGVDSSSAMGKILGCSGNSARGYCYTRGITFDKLRRKKGKTLE